VAVSNTSPLLRCHVNDLYCPGNLITRKQGADEFLTDSCSKHPGKAREVAKTVVTFKQVQYVGIYASLYDIVFWVAFRTLNDLEDFTKGELGRIPGLKEIDTIVNFKLVKMNFRIPI
jgi:DNA-binding Lrp family transcriptional regulator